MSLAEQVSAILALGSRKFVFLKIPMPHNTSGLPKLLKVAPTSEALMPNANPVDANPVGDL
jgi:hypothetical protein